MKIPGIAFSRLQSPFRAIQILFLLSHPGCAFLSFENDPIAVTVPAGESSVLPSGENPSITFSVPVDTNSAEQLFIISEKGIQAPGTYSWDSDYTVVFNPSPPLKEGRSYTLSFIGTLPGRNRGYWDTARRFSFFNALSGEGYTVTASAAPSPGSIIGCHDTISFAFSVPMNTESVENTFLGFPHGELELFWNQEETLLTAAPPPGGWGHGKTHTFSFSGTCRENNVEMKRRLTVSYQSAGEEGAPGILSLERGFHGESGSYSEESPGEFIFNETGADGLTYGETLRINFSVPMEREYFQYYIGIEPFMPGTFSWIDGSSLLFIPGRPFPYEKPFRLKADPAFRSASGTAMGFPADIPFRTGAPDYLRLLETGGRESNGFPLFPGTGLQASVTPLDEEGTYYFFLKFDRPIESSEAQLKTQRSIAGGVIFPSDISAPVPVSFSWMGSDTLIVKMTGFGVRSEGRVCYYRLTIRGGSTGAADDAGNVMKETISITLRYEP